MATYMLRPRKRRRVASQDPPSAAMCQSAESSPRHSNRDSSPSDVTRRSPPVLLSQSCRATRLSPGCLRETTVRLPFDVLLLAFSYLTSPEDRKAVLLTCKDWHAAMSHPSLWRDSCIVIRRTSVPLYLFRLLELRHIHSVYVTKAWRSCFSDCYVKVLRKLERVAPRSVTHLSVNLTSIPSFTFQMITGSFVQLPHLTSLTLEVLKFQFSGLEAHHLPNNLVELHIHITVRRSRLHWEPLPNYDPTLSQLLQNLGSLQHLSLENFCDVFIEIDKMPALKSLELKNCTIDRFTTPTSSEFSLCELRFTNVRNLHFPCVPKEVLSQLTVFEVSRCFCRDCCRAWNLPQPLNLNLSSYGHLCVEMGVDI